MTTEVTEPSNSNTLDINAATALYVELRDKVSELKARLKEDLKPYSKGLEDLDAILLKALQDQGAKTVRTPSGTVYQRVERSATTHDKLAFEKFIRDNELWDLIDWRPGKVAVFDWMEKNKAAVPGINTSAFMTIGVRRGEDQQE